MLLRHVDSFCFANFSCGKAAEFDIAMFALFLVQHN